MALQPPAATGRADRPFRPGLAVRLAARSAPLPPRPGSPSRWAPRATAYDNAVCESFHASPTGACSAGARSKHARRRAPRCSTTSRCSSTASGCTQRSATARPPSTNTTTKGVTACGRTSRFQLKNKQGLPNVYVSTEAGEAHLAFRTEVAEAGLLVRCRCRGRSTSWPPVWWVPFHNSAGFALRPAGLFFSDVDARARRRTWSLTARQCPQPLVVDGMHQRVPMTMHELPVRFGSAPEDPRDPQRPVLLREITDRAALLLDDDEHRQVAGRVGLDDLNFRLAPPKELG